MSDLEQVIQDSIDDATEPAETPEVDPTPELEASPEAPETSVEAPAEETEAEPSESSEVPSPAAQAAPRAPEDEFAKKHGLQPQLAGQRENRLPYSRVKKIVENAERKAIEPLTAKVAEFETRVKGYEDRLSEVGKFESLMVNDHMGFLTLLAERIPGYAEVLQYMAAASAQGKGEAPAEVQPPVDDGMPKPDYAMPDGSMVYSMDGLKARDAWNRDQAKKEAMVEVDKKYGFITEERKAQQYHAGLSQQVNDQIAEAQTWPGWSQEVSDKVAALLASNPRWNLERAYNAVMIPQLQSQITAAQADRTKVRADVRKEVLAEIKKAPSTSVPASGIKPRPSSQGPRSLEDVIRESIDTSGIR